MNNTLKKACNQVADLLVPGSSEKGLSSQVLWNLDDLLFAASVALEEASPHLQNTLGFRREIRIISLHAGKEIEGRTLPGELKALEVFREKSASDMVTHDGKGRIFEALKEAEKG